MARIRKNVWDAVNDPNDRTLEWYAKAVAAMRALPFSNPSSWRYQAAIHDYFAEADPLANAADPPPASAEQQRFFRQCQHNSWFFLPWHRMYLHHFERMVAAQVVRAGGPVDWALPYWDYSKDAASRRLPTPFREPLIDGQQNALFVEARNPATNAGQDFADEFDSGLTDALSAGRFANPQFGGSPGFGGPVTGFNHGAGPVGLLEAVPHGSMHGAVGGQGWMSAFNTAALDPIFWLHHANIDRLWQVWLNRNPAHVNPAESFWRTGVKFSFRAVDGSAVEMRCADVLDTLAPPFDYSYADVSDPLSVQESVTDLESVMAEQLIPEMVGATDTALTLGESTRHALIPTELPAASELESMTEARRVYLHIEHITADSQAPSYDVYLGVPPGADPSLHPDKRVGRLPLFGVSEASRKDGPSAGSGLTFALEVTNLVRQLRDATAWNPTELPVAFVPVRNTEGAQVRVGRVSVYVK